MLWTDITKKALIKAAELHTGQYRKGALRPPFITHPLAVLDIVSRYTDDADILAACLLHDTIEDTTYTPDEMRKDFGERITSIVLGVTIPEAAEIHNSWVHDRSRYIRILQENSAESALVAAGDKIHNFLSIIFEYSDTPDTFLNDFHGSPEDRIAVYGAVVAAIESKIPEGLSNELHAAWNAYKTLVESTISV